MPENFVPRGRLIQNYFSLVYYTNFNQSDFVSCSTCNTSNFKIDKCHFYFEHRVVDSWLSSLWLLMLDNQHCIIGHFQPYSYWFKK